MMVVYSVVVLVVVANESFSPKKINKDKNK